MLRTSETQHFLFEERLPPCHNQDDFRLAISWLLVAAFGLAASLPAAFARPGQDAAPVKVLIITGDHGHAWKDTTERLSDILGTGGKIKVDVTITPSKDSDG